MNKGTISEINEMIVEQSPDAIIFTDQKGIIRIWNTSAERVFGFSKKDAIGSSLDIIIPESFRKAHWQGFDRAITDRVTKYVGQSLPTKAVRADGSTIYVELSFSIVLDASGGVLGALSTARDITVRFERDRRDRRRLKELEENAK
ncbi:MAG: PAS domain S-box protein [Gammaproteobacteria bacterium]|nr:PAS domain S-box protein [Gammaproteobacteria bacterium]